jgi:hypothetical protein
MGVMPFENSGKAAIFESAYINMYRGISREREISDLGYARAGLGKGSRVKLPSAFLVYQGLEEFFRIHGLDFFR